METTGEFKYNKKEIEEFEEAAKGSSQEVRKLEESRQTPRKTLDAGPNSEGQKRSRRIRGQGPR